MRTRLLAWLPIALLRVGLLFASLSRFVYALELDDIAWEMGEHVEGCELVHDGSESAVRGEARPASYSF